MIPPKVVVRALPLHPTGSHVSFATVDDACRGRDDDVDSVEYVLRAADLVERMGIEGETGSDNPSFSPSVWLVWKMVCNEAGVNSAGNCRAEIFRNNPAFLSSNKVLAYLGVGR